MSSDYMVLNSKVEANSDTMIALTIKSDDIRTITQLNADVEQLESTIS